MALQPDNKEKTAFSTVHCYALQSMQCSKIEYVMWGDNYEACLVYLDHVMIISWAFLGEFDNL